MCCYLAVNAQLLSRCSLLQSSSSAQSLAHGPTSMKLEHFNTPPPLAGAGLTAIILPAFQQRVDLPRSSRRTECSVGWQVKLSIIATAPHQCVDVMTIAFCEIRAILINFQPVQLWVYLLIQLSMSFPPKRKGNSAVYFITANSYLLSSECSSKS